MKKINTILAAVGALLMLSVTSANSIEFKAGVSANGMAAYANATETLKGSTRTGRTTNEEAVLATNFGSAFVEISSEELMGLGVGFSLAPDVVTFDKETRHVDPVNSDSGNDAAGAQQVGANVEDLLSVYLTAPVPGSNGAYVKVGYIEAVLNTTETLSTGSAYENVDISGITVGGGYEGSLGDMVFWRAEGAYQSWDDINATGSQADEDDTATKNKIVAEMGSITGSLSIGVKF